MSLDQSQGKPLAEDIADLRTHAQRIVDRNVAARFELDSSNKEIADFQIAVTGGAADVQNFINAYLHPTTSNPSPIAPEVAAPAPAFEPPVFTDVRTPELDPFSTSGGFVPEGSIAEEPLEIPEAPVEVETPTSEATPEATPTTEGETG